MNENLLANKLHEHVALLWKIRDEVRLLTGHDYELDVAQRRIGSAARKLTKAARDIRNSTAQPEKA